MDSPFDKYLLQLRQTPLDQHTEHTGRAALEALLNDFAAKAEGGGISVQHEPKRDSGKGAPDFKITRNGMILGYVEVKEIGTNLERVRKSPQIKKYLELSENILLTDYLQWMWLGSKGEVKGQETLAYASDLESRTIRVREDRAEHVATMLNGFFSTPPEGIGRSQQLALALATRSRLLRDYIGEELVRQARDHQEGRLHGLFKVFKDQVFHELTLAEFADAFAQMLAYGLFLARLNSGETKVTLANAREFVPRSFELIRELIDFIGELQRDEYREVRWVIEEVLSIVNGLDLAAIHQDLSFRQRRAISRTVRAGNEEEHRLFERDPFIYFYEDFLNAYDPATRKGRGVYYTPPPVVNFIVRAIDDILKTTFGIADGLADNRNVTVLDFACGTGTFLLEVFQQALQNVGGRDAGRASPLVHEHFLKNVFGFEYLIAPYTIAHLKLSQFLRDQGHSISDGERLQVFLTNTLEPMEPQSNLLLPAVTAEVRAAQDVKDRDILVITGNPPYSGESRNKGRWITSAIGGYKFTIERDATGSEARKPLGERTAKWLNDDYVKFIRFAQLKMDDAPEGIVGVITNHSWLDNPTFRGMRQSLMRSFQQIYVIDLHGNAKKKESAPDGSKDENVFDIEQGVAISLFVKRPGLERGVWRGDLWGKRLEKYRWLAEASFDPTGLQPVEPASPHYLILLQDQDRRKQYELGLPIPDIFELGGTGIITKRDKLAIHYAAAETWDVVRRFVQIDAENARTQFGLPEDVRDWKVADAQADILLDGPDRTKVKEILYRPFDHRFTYYTGRSRGFLGWPVERVMGHMHGTNIALIIDRITKDDPTALVTDKPVAHKAATRYDISYTYPLWADSRENVKPDFRLFLDRHYDHHYTPEEILGYIYAILHAPTYRSRYAEFLRIDFPRIPFPESAANFEALSAMGWALVQAHLLRSIPRKKLAQFHGQGDQSVAFVRYAEADNTVAINNSQKFGPLPPEVWNFHIGGYQVLDKYLKSRKGRTLSLDEINHVSAVADSLAFTIEQMASIDEAYKAAFPDRG